MLLNNYQNTTQNTNNINNVNNIDNTDTTNHLLWRPYNSRIEDPKKKEISNFNIMKDSVDIQHSNFETKSNDSKNIQINESKNITYSKQSEDKPEYLETTEEPINQEYGEYDEKYVDDVEIEQELEDGFEEELEEEEHDMGSGYVKGHHISDENYENNLINFIKKNTLILSIVVSIIIVFIPIIIRFVKNKYIYLQIIKEQSLGLTKI